MKSKGVLGIGIIGCFIVLLLVFVMPPQGKMGGKSNFSQLHRDKDSLISNPTDIQRPKGSLVYDKPPLNHDIDKKRCEELRFMEERERELASQKSQVRLWELYRQGVDVEELVQTYAGSSFTHSKWAFEVIEFDQFLALNSGQLMQSDSGRALIARQTALEREMSVGDFFSANRSMRKALEEYWREELPDIYGRNFSEDEFDSALAQIKNHSGPPDLMALQASPALVFYLNLVQQGHFSYAAKVLDNFPELIANNDKIWGRLIPDTLASLYGSFDQDLITSGDFKYLWDKVSGAGTALLTDSDLIMFPEGKSNSAYKMLRSFGVEVPAIYVKDYPFEINEDIQDKLSETLPDSIFFDPDLIACKEHNKAIESRQFVFDELGRYEASEFIDAVRQSPEAEFCASSEDVLMEQYAQKLNFLMPLLRKLRLEFPRLEEFPLAEVYHRFPSQAENSFTTLMLTDVLASAYQRTKTEVRDWLIQHEYKVEGEYLALSVGIVGEETIALWMPNVELESKDIERFMLKAAEKGWSELYQQGVATGMASWDEQQLDPLYFALKNYNTYEFSIGGSHINSRAVLDMAQEEFADLNDSHWRALYELQQTSRQSYEALIKQYPKFTLNNPPDYFSVECN